MLASTKPFHRGSLGWGMLGQQNHANGGANGYIMVGMWVCLCFATSLKPSQKGVFCSPQTQNGLSCKAIKQRKRT